MFICKRDYGLQMFAAIATAEEWQARYQWNHGRPPNPQRQGPCKTHVLRLLRPRYRALPFCLSPPFRGEGQNGRAFFKFVLFKIVFFKERLSFQEHLFSSIGPSGKTETFLSLLVKVSRRKSWFSNLMWTKMVWLMSRSSRLLWFQLTPSDSYVTVSLLWSLQLMLLKSEALRELLGWNINKSTYWCNMDRHFRFVFPLWAVWGQPKEHDRIPRI